MPKLLLDQNLSPRLIKRLEAEYPDSAHVSQVGLDRATDREVWEYARSYGFIIATKDSDFSDLSVIRGFPPKIIWLRLGNCSTTEIEQALRNGINEIEKFAQDGSASVLELE